MFINDLFNDDDKLNESLKGMTSSLKHSLRSSSLDANKNNKKDTFGLTGELAETEHDWGEYEDDDEEQQDEGFFVAIGSEDEGAFVGMVTKDGGKWRESTVSGNAPYGWGGNYMSYLTPDDVMQHIRNDYGRHSQVKGPFSSEEAAMQYAQNHFDLGSDDDYDDHLNELSNEKLGQYKKAAGADAAAADARGDYKHGDKRFKGIVKATIKQGDNDSKKKINELGKDTLKRYARANVDDRMLRATGDSFRSGKAGDAYNNAPYDTPYDKKRERGFDRALDKLSKKGVEEATGDAKFDSMMGKMTSPESLNSREAVEMIFDLMHNSGASYKEALHQASVSYEIDPAELQALYKQQSRSLGEQGVAEGEDTVKTIRGPHGKLDVDRSKKGITKVSRKNYSKSNPGGANTHDVGGGVGIPHKTSFSNIDSDFAAYRKRPRLDYDDANEGVAEGFNRPDDHRGLGRELAHETNNIEISINGRVWKIFAGKGPDNSPEFFRQKQSVDAMCKRKTQETGKKWSWGVTGAAATNEGWKSAMAGAALAGSMALGGGAAHAQSQGEDFLPDIVAHVTFKVDGNTVTKDINLGTSFNSPGQASAALEKFLKEKGIKFYNFTLERVSDKKYNNNYLDKSPASAASGSGSMDDRPYHASGNSSNDYMTKNEAINLSKLRAATGAKVDTTMQDKIKQNRPRNFVAKNAINSGAGKHADKKKAVKQGVEKHKKPVEIDEDYELLQAVAESMERSGYEFTEAANPAQQAAIAINMKKQHKKPKTEEKQRLDPSCWTGYKKQGTKLKGGVRVNNCVPK